jgi:hypothetical protein
MKLLRLWQPGRLAFWLMLAFNALSSLCSFAMRTWPLNTMGLVLMGCVALLNVAGGLWAAWQLVKDPGPTETEAADGPAQSKPAANAP